LKIVLTIAAVAFSLVPCAAQAAVYVDNFDDNVRGPQWSEVADDPSLAVSETSGRLNVLANAPDSPNFDAIYLSDGPQGFRLSTATDFAITIDYIFTAATLDTPGGGLGLVFGVGTDETGFNSAAIGYGYSGLGTTSTVVVSRTNDDPTPRGFDLTLPNTGQFAVVYVAANDALIFGTFVNGNPTEVAILDDVVKGDWNADSLLVSFGARGNGYSTSFGDAYFDNFAVQIGTLVPEPTALAIIGLSAVALLGGRRRRAL
jgi:hypothetical protein